MNVCLIAPTIYPLGLQSYGGIERLVILFARGVLYHGHQVEVFCPDGSTLPRGVVRHDTGPARWDFREPHLAMLIQYDFHGKVFLDFSHSKVAGHLTKRHISPIWHDPYIMKPNVPHNNIAALSRWQAERFREIYNQDCRVLDPICADGDYFTLPELLHREGFVVFLAKLSPDKGALEAIESCRAIKQRLILVGPVTPGDPPEYVEKVRAACDGTDIVYLPGVTEAVKRYLYQTATAMIYPVSYPPGTGEAHLHKAVEANLCGCPVIAYDQGAMRELIEENDMGLVISSRDHLERAILWCQGWNREWLRKRAFDRWDYRNVVGNWEAWLKKVQDGLTW